MNSKKGLSLTAALATLGTPFAVQAADDASVSIYGSLRTGIEHVDPNTETVDTFQGMKDAYSRLGIEGSKEFKPGYEGFFKYELGIDSTTGEIGTLGFDGNGTYGDNKARVSKIGMSTPFGTVQAGKMWGLFYNAIAFPVDVFSSYYAGWSTNADFRIEDAIVYNSPSFNGLSFNAGYAFGPETATQDFDKDFWTVTGGYNKGGSKLNVAYTLRRNEGGEDVDVGIIGVAGGQQIGDLYLGAKYEEVLEGVPGGEMTYRADGNTGYNFLATYNLQPVTLKAMYGDTEGNTNETIHLGMDYQFADNLKFFAEWYQDDGGGFAPVAYDHLANSDGDVSPDAFSGFNNPESKGGDVYTIGAHLSFSSQVL